MASSSIAEGPEAEVLRKALQGEAVDELLEPPSVKAVGLAPGKTSPVAKGPSASSGTPGVVAPKASSTSLAPPPKAGNSSKRSEPEQVRDSLSAGRGRSPLSQEG